ncbi:MAG: hypothetical protein KKE71_02860, partial [Nanoarchaeota archaeon]|nr:hypothetical protein [Nanoarchaeota archaeon]
VPTFPFPHHNPKTTPPAHKSNMSSPPPKNLQLHPALSARYLPAKLYLEDVVVARIYRSGDYCGENGQNRRRKL